MHANSLQLNIEVDYSAEGPYLLSNTCEVALNWGLRLLIIKVYHLGGKNYIVCDSFIQCQRCRYLGMGSNMDSYVVTHFKVGFPADHIYRCHLDYEAA